MYYCVVALQVPLNNCPLNGNLRCLLRFTKKLVEITFKIDFRFKLLIVNFIMGTVLKTNFFRMENNAMLYYYFTKIIINDKNAPTKHQTNKLTNNHKTFCYIICPPYFYIVDINQLILNHAKIKTYILNWVNQPMVHSHKC